MRNEFQKPYSKQGLENYDKVFGKKKKSVGVCVPANFIAVLKRSGYTFGWNDPRNWTEKELAEDYLKNSPNADAKSIELVTKMSLGI